MTLQLAEALLRSGKAEQLTAAYIRKKGNRVSKNFRSDWMFILGVLPHFKKKNSPHSFGVVAFKLENIKHDKAELFCEHALLITDEGLCDNKGKYHRVDQSSESNTWIVHC